jgi:CIC family chloride channel protein
MLVSSVSYLLLGRTSLYEKQVLAPIASPTHIAEFARDLMKGMHVYEAVNQRPATVIPEEMSYNELVEVILKSGHTCFPVVNEDGRMTGIISANDVHDKIFQETPSHLVFAKDLANPDIVPIFWHDTLEGALDKMVALQMDALPVVHEESPDIVATMISKHDILSFYHSVSEFKE